MTGPVIELSSVSKTFDGAVAALVDMDLAVLPGEFVAVTGRSGSGKTTLLNILGLLDRPTAGSYRLDGEAVDALTERRRSELRARRVGFVFQDAHLIPSRTCLENVELGLQLAGFPRGRARTERSADMLRAVGLAHRLYAKPPTLSGGERQRVAIARALAGGPSVVLCDEPTGNLDVDTGELVMQLIEEIPQRGASVILVTHELDLAARADRIVRLENGRRTDTTIGRAHERATARWSLGSRRGGALARLVDFLDDIGLNASRTPIRNLLAGIGAFLAVAIFVFSAAVTTTSAVEVASSFDRLAATSVELGSRQIDTSPIVGSKVDTRRIEDLPGAVAAGVRWRLGELLVAPGAGPWIAERRAVPANAVDLRAIDVLGLSLDGRSFTATDFVLARPVALVGVAAAREFDSKLAPGMVVVLDGIEFELAGIITDAERGANVLTQIVVPTSTALELWPSRESSAEVLIEVEVGSAEVIAAEAPMVVNANRPDHVVALYDPEAVRLRRTITTQVDATALLVGLGLLITGAFGIAGSMVAAISERRREIGIRRAQGATRGAIVRLIMGEAALTGTVASVAGLVAGLATFLVVSIDRQWSPILVPEVLIAAPVAGVVAGLVAGIVPALYAARIEPAQALRS